MASVSELLLIARNKLSEITETPRLDAEVLLAHVIEKTRMWLIAHPEAKLSDQAERKFEQLLSRRLEREPIAYIVGEKEFYGLPFRVTPAVLIPRPETELIVDRALELLRERGAKKQVLDLGTGSGCIAVAIASESECSVIAVDVSADALLIAADNAERHGVSKQCRFLEGSWFSGVQGEKFDIIVSNPPYVSREEELAPELGYEPEKALYAEDDGMADIRYLIEEAPKYLKDGGVLLLECGQGQGGSIREIVKGTGFTCTFHKDLQGIERVAYLT